MTNTAALPRDPLAAELGSVVGTLERELRLQMATLLAEAREEIAALRAWRAEAALELAARVGPAGPQGEPGDAIVGPAGIQGPAGEQGIQGPPGRFMAPVAWQRGIHYDGALATHAGATWCALRDTAEEPPHDDWVCVAERGADGRTPAFRGAWKAASTYEAFDVAMVEGSSFIALYDVPGPCPGDGWRLIASRGKSGPPGAAGPQGERGWPGMPAPTPVALDVDGEGLLTLRFGDGVALSCDLYPVLAKLR